MRMEVLATLVAVGMMAGCGGAEMESTGPSSGLESQEATLAPPIAESAQVSAVQGDCKGTANPGAEVPQAASNDLACIDGSSACSNGRCLACCHGLWYDINTCQYGVHFSCNGFDYNAYNCWPIGRQPAE